MVAPLRIAYFGTPQFAVPTLRRLLASRHPVVGVVTQPDRPRGRGQKVTDSPVKALALEHGIPVFQPTRLKEPATLDTIRGWQPDLGVVAAYGRIIPDALLELPRLGMINVHASLLPKYRGAAPVHRAVIDGETVTGVTIMRMVARLDAGDMLASVSRAIGPDETSDAVERDLAELGGSLLMDVVEQLAAGTARQEPQDDALSSYAARLTKDEGLIDWTLPAAAIHNRVRGLHPWPHAFSFLDGARIILLATRLAGRLPGDGTAAAPGAITAVSRDTIEVAAGDGGVLSIERLQAEGRRPMTAREFLASRPLLPAARFSSP